MDTESPRVAETIDELIAGASDRVSVQPEDGKSGASFERLTIDGEPHFLKVLSAESDWIMRCTGNTTNWEFQVWKAGMNHRTPRVIDHTIVSMALEGDGPTARLAMLMTDCGNDLIPPGDAPLSVETHHRFIDHMAEMHACFIGWEDTIGLGALDQRLLFFAPATIAPELLVDDVPVPVRVADQGWAILRERSPQLHAIVSRVHTRPDELATALRATPQTFIAGDWKMGNLGERPDGRTIVLDWAYPGEAPPAWELCWYLALNRARIPISKEDTIDFYRASIERHGVDTAGWWERQLGLCLLALTAVIGWEKAVGDRDEFEWWEAAALDGVRWMD